MLKYPACLVAAFAVTYVLTPWVRRCALRLGIMDRPGGRHAHRRPLPRCGGVAVFIGFNAACALTNTLVVLALLGAALAFLRFIFYPGSIFLGDSDSMFLGFTLAAIAFNTGTKGPAAAALGVPLMAFGVPFIDTLLAAAQERQVGVKQWHMELLDLNGAGAESAGADEPRKGAAAEPAAVGAT